MELTNEFTVPVPVERAWAVLNDVELIAPCLPGAQLQEVEDDEYRGTVKVKVGPITAQYKGVATFLEQDEVNRKTVLKAEGRDTRGQGSASAIITATMTASGSSTDVVVHSDVTIKGKVAQFGRGMIADVSAKLLTQFVECLETKLEAEPSATTSGDPAPTSGSTTPDSTTPDSTATTGDSATEAAKAQADAPAPASSVPGSTSAPGGGPAATTTTGSPAAEAAKAQAATAQAATAASSGPRKIDAPVSAPVDLLDAAGAPLAKRLLPAAVVVILLILIGRRRRHRS